MSVLYAPAFVVKRGRAWIALANARFAAFFANWCEKGGKNSPWTWCIEI
jgi:hypothetical protein